jgi:hypothetical protein
MVQSQKIVQLLIVTALPSILLLLYIYLPYPPSRWTRFAFIGLPLVVGVGFEAWLYHQSRTLTHPIRLALWVGILYLWEFLSLLLALAVHGT